MVLLLVNHGIASGESWYCSRRIMVLLQVNHGIASGESLLCFRLQVNKDVSSN